MGRHVGAKACIVFHVAWFLFLILRCSIRFGAVSRQRPRNCPQGARRGDTYLRGCSYGRNSPDIQFVPGLNTASMQQCNTFPIDAPLARQCHVSLQCNESGHQVVLDDSGCHGGPPSCQSLTVGHQAPTVGRRHSSPNLTTFKMDALLDDLKTWLCMGPSCLLHGDVHIGWVRHQ